MRIGCPREVKIHEYRVGLTPGAVREYAAAGHQVVVERGAGAGIAADGSAYANAGAILADSAEEVFATTDMVVKVKEPQPSEWTQLREGKILYTYLHLAADPRQIEGLLASGCTAIAYETVIDSQGTLPLLTPMSEVAGRLSIEAAAFSLRKQTGGRGVLLGGVPGVEPASVVIIGGGVVGAQAARMAVGLGADVTVLDRSLARLRALDKLGKGLIRTRFSTAEAIETKLHTADVVIGAVLIPGAAAPKLVTRAMLAAMRRGTVLIDVAIDQGGCFETSRPTTHADPTFEVDGIIHYCVTNMPGAVPLTSSHALNNATLWLGLALANGGLHAIRDNAHLRAGLNVHRGRLTCKPVADSLGFAFCPPEGILAA